MNQENQPIRISIYPDHLSILKKDLPHDDKLAKLFSDACVGVTITEYSAQGKDYVGLFGSKDQLFEFMWQVTMYFDLLIV